MFSVLMVYINSKYLLTLTTLTGGIRHKTSSKGDCVNKSVQWLRSFIKYLFALFLYVLGACDFFSSPDDSSYLRMLNEYVE